MFARSTVGFGPRNWFVKTANGIVICFKKIQLFATTFDIFSAIFGSVSQFLVVLCQFYDIFDSSVVFQKQTTVFDSFSIVLFLCNLRKDVRDNNQNALGFLFGLYYTTSCFRVKLYCNHYSKGLKLEQHVLKILDC